MEKTLVFVEGNYLSLVAKQFFDGKPPTYDINKFAINLSKEQNLWCGGVFYYTAPPYQSPKSTKAEDHRMQNYDKFVSKLRKIPNFTVREGRCQKTGDGFQEKGVDTLLTMDLMNAALDKGIKRVILVSCDTDFVPIITRLREDYKTEVTLYYFSDFVRNSRFSMSNHILNACDKGVLIKKEHFEQSRF